MNVCITNNSMENFRRISYFRVIIDENKTNLTIKEVINYYALAYYLVYKSKCPKILQYLGEAFASLMTPVPNSINIDAFYPEISNLHIRVKTKADLAILVTEFARDQITSKLTTRSNGTWCEYDTLCTIFRELDRNPEICKYLTNHQKPLQDIEWIIRKFQANIPDEDVINVKRVLQVLHHIFRDLEKMSNVEFTSIQEKVYKHTKKALRDFITAKAGIPGGNEYINLIKYEEIFLQPKKNG